MWVMLWVKLNCFCSEPLKSFDVIFSTLYLFFYELTHIFPLFFQPSTISSFITSSLQLFALSGCSCVFWSVSSRGGADWIQASWLWTVKVSSPVIDRPWTYCMWPWLHKWTQNTSFTGNGKVWRALKISPVEYVVFILIYASVILPAQEHIFSLLFGLCMYVKLLLWCLFLWRIPCFYQLLLSSRPHLHL